MFIYVHVYIVCQGYTPRVLTKYSIFRKNTTSKAHQNEKICQHAMQSTFLTVIIYSSLTLSLLLSFFFLRVRSFFVLFGAWFPSQTRNIFPKRNPSGSLFPCTHTSSPRLLAKKTPISLSHIRAERRLPFSRFYRKIYILYIFFFFSLVVWRSKRARRKNHLNRETIRFFRYSFRARFSSSVKRFDWRR